MIVRNSAPMYVNFEKFIRSTRGEKVDESLNPVLKDKDRIWITSRAAPNVLGSINVFGEVTRPTANIPLRPSATMTVREVINLAGGTMPTADRKRVSIRRAGIDKPLIVDLDKAEQGDLINNIELKADDTVYVEKLETSAFINVNGGVVRSGKVVYDKRTTLTQAIEEVGGLAPYAKAKEGIIIRHPDNDPNHTKTIKFNYDNIRLGKQPDIELLAGDTVMVPNGAAPRQAPGVFDYLGALGNAGFLISAFKR